MNHQCSSTPSRSNTIHTRRRYQNGTLTRVPRKKGPDVWVFRWRDYSDGKAIETKKVIGGVDQFPRKADALLAVESLRTEINAAQKRLGKITVSEAWRHFQLHELRDPDMRRSPTTIDNYLALFRKHIIPSWGDVPLEEIKAIEAEQWLRSLTELAPASRAKIKSRMCTLFSHAIRHEMCAQNPMEHVRQGSKRVSKPDILALEEIGNLMREVTNPAIRVAVLVAATTGLRRSEVRGLKWKDIDLNRGWLTPERGVVRKDLTSLKNKSSGATIPIPAALVQALQLWRDETQYCADDDWVFASPVKSGRSPYWFDAALVRQLRPAAKRAKITKHIAWHTFRRSLATLLAMKGEGVKVVQELMRHANSRITLDVYTQGDEQAKRKAQEHVNGLFVVT